MKRLPMLLTAIVLVTATACTPALPDDAWIIDGPANGEQYRITEICDLLQAEGYDIGGSLGYTVTADDLGFLLDDLPGLVRGATEVAIGDGVRLTLQLDGLCRYTG